jgi:hypothetical protein
LLARSAFAEESLSVQGTVGLGQNEAVAGESEGAALALGYVIDAAMHGDLDAHRFGAALSIAQAYSYSLVANAPLVLADDVSLTASYRFGFSDIASVIMKVEFETSPLGALYVSPSAFTVDGGVRRRQYDVSDPFAPTRIEGFGGAAIGWEKAPTFGVESAVGFAHFHAFGAEALLLSRDEGVRKEFVATRDAHAMGPSATLEVRTNLEERVRGEIAARGILPIAATNLTDVAEDAAFCARGLIGLQLTPWLGVEYHLKVDWSPLERDRWSVENDAYLAFQVAKVD